MIVSNSQIMSLQICEMRFYFEHNDTLRPVEFPINVARGIFGHELAEAFFKKMQAGGTYEECVDAVNPVLLQGMNDPELLKAYRLVIAFGAWVFTQPWEVVEAECNHIYPVNGDEYAYTPDLVFRWTSGPKRGQLFIIDFKFTGQYWNENELNAFQQLPKYMIYWNKEKPKEKVTNCAVAMLNTRAAAGAKGEQLFLFKWLNINKKKLQEIERENEIMIKRVKHVKETYQPEDYMRTVNTFACKMCFFAKPCTMALAGQDNSNVLRTLFTHNTYFEDNYGTEEVS